MAALIMCIDEIFVGLFYRNMVKYFGVASNIVIDHDMRFRSRFWRVLFNMMRTRLKFFTANHPQTDGQLEMINVFLEEYLRFYIGWNCWIVHSFAIIFTSPWQWK